ncbi:MAG: PLP-dependent aminotransferase family protein [Pseudobdellovibrionaceae bacterium]
MKTLLLQLPKSKKTLHLKVADSIRGAILNGQLLPGEKLPSSRVLAKQLGIHRQTIMAAFEELAMEGWTVSLLRKGYLVADSKALQFVTAKMPIRKPKQDHQYEWRWRTKVNLGSFQAETPIRYNFQSGLPDLELFPKEEFRSHIAHAMKKGSKNLLGYGSPYGIEPLRKAIDTCLRRLKNISDRTTIITHGSQEAVYLTIRLLVQAGDCVAIEDPGYPPLQELLRTMGAKTLPLPLDGEGLIPEKLEAAVKKFPIRVLFLTPLHQFPSTVILSAPRRIQIYEIARKHSIAIVEDDYDHEFHYRTQPLEPMASHDTYGQVIYLSTLSKLMFPGARLGFMSVPQSFAKNFTQYRRLVTHANESITQQALASWILDGGFERHLNRMRRVYERRLKTIEESLDGLKTNGKVSWQSPSGGMALWLDVKQNSTNVAEKALEKGIFVTPESYYRFDGKPGTHMRVGFSNQSENNLKAGIAEFEKILR